MDLSSLLAALGPLQQSMQQAEAERAAAVFEGTAGGGAVTVRLTGGLTISSVRIAPAAATGGDVGMLEDVVAAAVNDALRQYRARFGTTAQEQMQKLMAGKDLGGLGAMLGPLLGGR